MGCALAALWVPDKNIALSLTRSGQPMSPESLQRAQHHLMAWMQLQQRTIVVNHISKVASDVAAPYKILACPVRHPSERVMGVLALFNPPSAPDFDLHQTRIAEVLAKRATSIIQAQYDSSTGLMTRQAFERQATALLGSASAADTHIILYLDIDRLHVINETFGMHVGDDVIVSVAECMAKSLPPGALSARISGDRLAALIPNSSMDAAALVAEKIRAAAAAIVPRAGQGSFEVSACLGVAPDRPLRQSARACAGDRGDRLQGGQGPRPQSRRNVPGFRSEHHPAAHRHHGHRQAARRAGQRQLPSRRAAHTAAARQLRPPALRIADPHAGRSRRNHPAGQIPLRGRALPAHAHDRPLGGAPCLRAARRAQRVGGRGHRALRHQSFRPIAAGRVVSGVRGRANQDQRRAARRAVLRTDRNRDHRQSGQGAEFHAQPAEISAASSRSTISAPA